MPRFGLRQKQSEPEARGQDGRSTRRGTGRRGPWAKPSPTRDGALPDATLEGAADASRVAADVATLAAAPRGRHHPAQMHRAQSYVTEQLTTAGWQVRSVLFTRRWVLGVSDAGGRSSFLRRLRLFPRLTGINLLADLPGASAGRRVLIVAHLD